MRHYLAGIYFLSKQSPDDVIILYCVHSELIYIVHFLALTTSLTNYTASIVVLTERNIILSRRCVSLDLVYVMQCLKKENQCQKRPYLYYYPLLCTLSYNQPIYN